LDRFYLILGLPEDGGAISREAVRAVVSRENKLLMVRTNWGSYSFPGGGVQSGESHEEALCREVSEETGYVLSRVGDKLGEAIERRADRCDAGAVFYMESHYYQCEVSGVMTARQLEDYEAALGLEAVWIDLESALVANETLLNGTGHVHPWVYRETNVLKELKRKG